MEQSETHIKPQLLQSNLPTVSELHAAMMKDYTIESEVLSTMLYRCAESAHRLMLRSFDPTYQKRVSVWREKKGSGCSPGNHYRITGYQCPVCKGWKLKTRYKHCPDCGVLIEWR